MKKNVQCSVLHFVDFMNFHFLCFFSVSDNILGWLCVVLCCVDCYGCNGRCCVRLGGGDHSFPACVCMIILYIYNIYSCSAVVVAVGCGENGGNSVVVCEQVFVCGDGGGGGGGGGGVILVGGVGGGDDGGLSDGRPCMMVVVVMVVKGMTHKYRCSGGD